MRTIGAYEAKTHLARLLEEVARGERFEITRHRVPIAVLVPPPAASKASPRNIVDELRAFRRGLATGGVALREMIEEGRRF